MSAAETVTVAIVYHSVSGRTRALAHAAAKGISSVAGATPHILSVEDASAPHGQAALAGAQAIVFGSPTYMGSASAAFKGFMDGTSAIWALQGWRDKLAAGFTHSAGLSGDKLGTLMQLAVFAAQHGMIWIGLGLPPTYASLESGPEETNRLGSHLGAMAQSRPGGGQLPESDLVTAEHLGRRVAEATLRFRRGVPLAAGSSRSVGDSDPDAPERHPTTRGWTFARSTRPALPGGVERINLKEIVARPGRFEHHLIACATVDGVRLEVVTASEPLYFAHINLSDEYAIALSSGDELVDRFPLRTFLSDPTTGEDVGRYNHRVGDVVLHPEKYLHWPGRLRPPYDPFEFPPGMRRTGISLVYCASKPTRPTWSPLPAPPGREADVKPYVQPAPPMILTSLRSAPGAIARIGRTELSLLELPKKIEPPFGGWLVVVEADPQGPYAPCDLLRIPSGVALDGGGITRALLLASDELPPDPIPPSWAAVDPPPIAPYEEQEERARATLPLEAHGVGIDEVSERVVRVSLRGHDAEVPRYWLARTLFRIALHELKLGYIETYGGVFFDDRNGDLAVGLRSPKGPLSVSVPNAEALAFVARLYQAVAPEGYRERLL